MLLVVLDRNGARLTLDDSWAWCVWWGQRTTDGRREIRWTNTASQNACPHRWRTDQGTVDRSRLGGLSV